MFAAAAAAATILLGTFSFCLTGQFSTFIPDLADFLKNELLGIVKGKGNKKAQLSLTNPRDACEKFARCLWCPITSYIVTVSIKCVALEILAF